MHPSDEVLAAIALGDDAPQPDVEHVRGCPSCSAVVADVADLTARVGQAAGVLLVEPPVGIWAAIEAELGDSADEPGLARADGARLGAPHQHPASATEGRWSRRAWLVAAAAAGVAIGVAGAQLLPRLAQAPPTLLAQATLDTLDTKKPGGEATLTRTADSLELTLSVNPLDAGSGYLEVWLINTDLARMVSIGVLPAGVSQQVFPITASLIDQGYRIVDISREQFDSKPEHSGDSLLRGTLG